jgi:hypothetical protein
MDYSSPVALSHLKRGLVLILLAAGTSVPSRADIAEPGILFTCRPDGSSLSLSYTYSNPHIEGAEFIPFHGALVVMQGNPEKGGFYAPQTVTRTCASANGKIFNVHLTGVPANTGTPNGTCGEVFSAKIVIEKMGDTGQDTPAADFEGLIEDQSGPCRINESIKEINFDMKSNAP